MTTRATLIGIEGLYNGHSAWLRGWLHRYTRCSEKAADLAQDTFCKLLESRSAEAPSNPRPYLATVARRLMIDGARRAVVERTFIETHAALVAGASAPCPERIIAAVAELTAVMRELDTLPERARQAFLMARLDGTPHAQIAATLGVSRSSVKQYVARGLACCYAAAYGARPGL